MISRRHPRTGGTTSASSPRPRLSGAATLTAAVTAAACLLLAGCSATASTPPLTESQRSALRARIFDPQWALVTAQYPEALRPRVPVVRTVPDADWVPLVADCLARSGFDVQADSGGLSYRSGQGQLPIEYAVSSFACYSEYPTVGQATAGLEVSALGALYDYYTSFLRPCLLAAGQPSPAPPSRREYLLLRLEGQPSWDPYERITPALLPGQQVGYLELRCPPVPQWLDLAQR